MKPLLIYCYDAWCGWCYGFSNVMVQLVQQYSHRVDADVLSGGMILTDKPVHISATAPYIQSAYKTVEAHTGVQFGRDYLWHIENHGDSDWFPHSEKPAIAMSIFKELYPNRSVAFAADLQYALHFEGRDLTDNEAYRHLLEKYGIDAPGFYQKLQSDAYRDKAHYDFALVKQLQVTGYPAVLLQTGTAKFYLLARGYTPYDTLSQRLENVLNEVGAP